MTAKESDFESQEGIILFADIMNSALLSYFLSPKEYDEILQEFREIAEKNVAEICEKQGIKKSEIEKGCSGDELKAFIIPKNQGTEGIQNALKVAGGLAFRVKIQWLFSESNIERIRSKKAPTDIGVGINIGPVTVRLPKGEKGGPCCEGYTITLCKRIESASRRGTDCQILLSQNAQELIPDTYEFGIQTRAFPELEMKGIPNPPRLYEVSGFNFIQHSIPYDYLHDLVKEDVRPLEQFSEQAMQICRQSFWYGLLTIALLQVKKSESGWLETTRHQIDIATRLLRGADNLSLFQFLGFMFHQMGFPEQAVMHNKKALNMDPNSIMAQFNLSVAMSQTTDSHRALEGKSIDLCKRVVEQYKKCEQIYKSYGLSRTDYDWKIPLFKAHAVKSLAQESHWEQTGYRWPETSTFSAQESFWIEEALALYQKAQSEIPEKHRGRWLTECLVHYADGLQMLGRIDEAKEYYEKALTDGKTYVESHPDTDVMSLIKRAEDQLKALA